MGGIDLRQVGSIEYGDLRQVQSGEPCPRCDSPLQVFTAIELGHIFKLGTKYSQSMGAMFLDEKGKEHPIIMGSYGIGVERVMACLIEKHDDDKGIIGDATLAPFHVNLLGLNLKNETVTKACEEIYNNLTSNSYEVFFDDRMDAQAGVKFNDADLLGMPLQIIVGDRKLKTTKLK